MTAWSQRAPRTAWRNGEPAEGARDVPEETAVAFTYNASTYAVMMATPADLQDFAIGFSLTESVIERPEDILELDLIESDLGVEARMWLDDARAKRLVERRRRLAGPTGCGLCGVESLEEANRPRAPVVEDGIRITPAEIVEAMAALTPAQALNAATNAVHAAGFWRPGEGLVAAREDIGRHNALDKLIGAMARAGVAGEGGAILLTSRVSVEMVQKTAIAGAALIVAVSAPTALALRAAEAAGITLIAIARGDGFEVFTRPDRVLPDASARVRR